jgi:transposase InsO family protein
MGMKLRPSARLTPAGRAELVRRILDGQPAAEVARALHVSLRTARKWLARFKAEGAAGLADRPSTAHRRPHALRPEQVARILELRRQHLLATRIAPLVGCSHATVSKHLRRHRLSRARDLDAKEPARRYQRERPGELIHLDVKKLGRIERVGHRITGDRSRRSRGAGWELTHVAVDDASRLAYAEVLPSDGRDDSTAFLERALAWLAGYGIKVERVMTDNGPAYRSRTFATLCRRHGLKHLRTRPCTPRTNGLETASPFLPPGDRPRPMAERFIQTALREWAYTRPYPSPRQRADHLGPWIHRYNHHRPHTAIAGLPPSSRAPVSNPRPNDRPAGRDPLSPRDRACRSGEWPAGRHTHTPYNHMARIGWPGQARP